MANIRSPKVYIDKAGRLGKFASSFSAVETILAVSIEINYFDSTD